MEKLAISLIALTALQVLPGTAHAQTAPGADSAERPPDRPPLRAVHASAGSGELDSIEAQHTAAVVLYVVGPLLHVGGVALGLAGLVGSICFGCASRSDARPMLISGFTAAGIGLITLFIAIGLDVGSGNRRRGLSARGSALNLQVGPTGAALSGVF